MFGGGGGEGRAKTRTTSKNTARLPTQPEPAPLRPQAFFIVVLGMLLLMAARAVVGMVGRRRQRNGMGPRRSWAMHREQRV